MYKKSRKIFLILLDILLFTNLSHALYTDALSPSNQAVTSKLNTISSVSAVILIFILVAVAFLSRRKK